MRSLTERCRYGGQEENFGDILVPTEESGLKFRDGKKRKERKKVLIQLCIGSNGDVIDASWQL